MASQGEEEEEEEDERQAGDVALENKRKRKAPSLEDGDYISKRPHMSSDAVLEV